MRRLSVPQEYCGLTLRVGTGSDTGLKGERGEVGALPEEGRETGSRVCVGVGHPPRLPTGEIPRTRWGTCVFPQNTHELRRVPFPQLQGMFSLLSRLHVSECEWWTSDPDFGGTRVVSGSGLRGHPGREWIPLEFPLPEQRQRGQLVTPEVLPRFLFLKKVKWTCRDTPPSSFARTRTHSHRPAPGPEEGRVSVRHPHLPPP